MHYFRRKLELVSNSSTHEKLNADINIVICTTSVQKRKLAWSKNDKKNKMFSKKHMQKSTLYHCSKQTFLSFFFFKKWQLVTFKVLYIYRKILFKYKQFLNWAVDKFIILDNLEGSTFTVMVFWYHFFRNKTKRKIQCHYEGAP